MKTLYAYFLPFLVFCCVNRIHSQNFIHLSSITQNLVAPVRIATGSGDTVYVTDAANKQILTYDASGNLLNTISPCTAPISLAVDNNNRLYTGDGESGEIFKVNPNGTGTLLYNGTMFPSSMVCVGDSIYIVDSKLKKVIVIDQAGNLVREIGNGSFTYPTGITYNPVTGNLLVAEHGGIGPGFNPVIKVWMFDLAGTVTGSFGSYGYGDGEFYRIQGLAVDRCGNIYVPDPAQGSVSVFDEAGVFMTRFGVYGESPGQLNLPLDITINSKDSIWITSMNNGALEVFKINFVTSSITGGTQTICSGQTADITIEFTGTAPWTFTYTVDSANPVTVTDVPSSPYSLTVSQAGTYIVSDLVGASCTGNNMTGSAVITVNSAPVVSAGNDQSVCAGNQVTLTASGAVTYSWDNGVSDGIPFTPLTTTFYSVTGTGANGCTYTDGVLITVNSLPVVSAGSDQSVCEGATVTLTGTGAVTYLWDNAVTDGVPFIPSVTATYTVTGTDANGCTGSDAVVVTVNTLQTIFAGIDLAVCSGTPVTLSGSGAVSYLWDNGVTDGVPFVPAATTTYTVTGTDANGCTNTDAVLVTVNTLPSVDAGIDQIICSGTPVTLSGNGAVSYVWNNGVTDGVPFVPVATATYTVTGTDANGCIGSDVVQVTVYPLPEAGFSFTTNGPEVTFLNSSTNASTFYWDFGDGDTSPLQNPVHTYQSTGTFIITLTASNLLCGSVSVSDTVSIVIIGSDKLVSENIVKVYPNPSGGLVNIEVTGSMQSDFSIEITDLLGRIIYAEKFAGQDSINEEINLSGVAKGIYTVKFSSGAGVIITKLVLNK